MPSFSLTLTSVPSGNTVSRCAETTSLGPGASALAHADDVALAVDGGIGEAEFLEALQEVGGAHALLEGGRRDLGDPLLLVERARVIRLDVAERLGDRSAGQYRLIGRVDCRRIGLGQRVSRRTIPGLRSAIAGPPVRRIIATSVDVLPAMNTMRQLRDGAYGKGRRRLLAKLWPRRSLIYERLSLLRSKLSSESQRKTQDGFHKRRPKRYVPTHPDPPCVQKLAPMQCGFVL